MHGYIPAKLSEVGSKEETGQFSLFAARLLGLLIHFCDTLIWREGSVLQLFLPPGAFYASTWPPRG